MLIELGLGVLIGVVSTLIVEAGVTNAIHEVEHMVSTVQEDITTIKNEIEILKNKL